MRIRKVLALFLGPTLIATPSAVIGEEVELLATWDAGVSFGTPQVIESAWPVLLYLGQNNEFIAPLFEGLALPPSYPVDIANSVSATEDPDFGYFVDRLTDGIDQEIVILAFNDELGFIGEVEVMNSASSIWLFRRLDPTSSDMRSNTSRRI